MNKAIYTTAIGILGLTLGLYAADVRLGTWQLNLKKSKVSGPAIKSQTDIREALPDGRVQITRTRELADGKIEKYSFSYKYDGREYPVKGAPFDMISVKRIDNNTTRFETTRKNSKATSIGTTVVSADRMTLTQTSKAVDAAGKMTESTLVFDRK
jgi:hypothetical protein